MANNMEDILKALQSISGSVSGFRNQQRMNNDPRFARDFIKGRQARTAETQAMGAENRAQGLYNMQMAEYGRKKLKSDQAAEAKKNLMQAINSMEKGEITDVQQIFQPFAQYAAATDNQGLLSTLVSGLGRQQQGGGMQQLKDEYEILRKKQLVQQGFQKQETTQNEKLTAGIEALYPKVDPDSDQSKEAQELIQKKNRQKLGFEKEEEVSLIEKLMGEKGLTKFGKSQKEKRNEVRRVYNEFRAGTVSKKDFLNTLDKMADKIDDKEFLKDLVDKALKKK